MNALTAYLDAYEGSNTDAYTPPEDLLDGAHPATGAYLQSIDRIKRAIVDASCGMYPMHLQIAKEAQGGGSYTQIASKLGVCAQTVANTLKRPRIQRLSALLSYLKMALDGPQEAQRAHFLWRIALANEKEDPRVAISAVAEINRMSHQRELFNTGNAGAGKLEINISAALTRTELDS